MDTREIARLRRENAILRAFYFDVRSADNMCGSASSDFHYRVGTALDGMQRRNVFRKHAKRRVYGGCPPYYRGS